MFLTEHKQQRPWLLKARVIGKLMFSCVHCIENDLKIGKLDKDYNEKQKLVNSGKRFQRSIFYFKY